MTPGQLRGHGFHLPQGFVSFAFRCFALAFRLSASLSLRVAPALRLLASLSLRVAPALRLLASLSLRVAPALRLLASFSLRVDPAFRLLARTHLRIRLALRRLALAFRFGQRAQVFARLRVVPAQAALVVQMGPEIQHLAVQAWRAAGQDRRSGEFLVHSAPQPEPGEPFHGLGAGVVHEVLPHAERFVDPPLLLVVAPPRRGGRHLQHEVRRLALVGDHVGRAVPLRDAERHQHVGRHPGIDEAPGAVRSGRLPVEWQVVHEDVRGHGDVVAVRVAVQQGGEGVLDPPVLLVAIRHGPVVRLRQVFLVQCEQREHGIARRGFRHGLAPVSVRAVYDRCVPGVSGGP